MIAFDDGHRLKLKTAYYALRHKAMANLAFEKNALALVVENAVDDVLPLLTPNVAERLARYRDRTGNALNRHLGGLAGFVADHDALDRREFAAKVQSTLDKRLQPIAFLMRDGKDAAEAMRRLLAWACHSDLRVDSVRDLFDLDWDSRGIELDAGCRDEAHGICC